MQTLLEDIRYSVRAFRRRPGLAITVIVTLGLGIGFTTAVYSAINAYILRPLPVKDPGRLVVLATRDTHTDFPFGLSYPDYRDYRDLTEVFADVLARREWPVAANLKREGQLDRIWIDAVTPNYFAVLGIETTLGRTFLPEEGRGSVAVLDYACWQATFDGDPTIVGKAINVNGQALTVVGVAPERFQGTQVTMRPDVYVPLQTQLMAQHHNFEARGDRDLRVIARLRPGVTVPQARSAVDVAAKRLELQFPDTNAGVRVITVPERFARPEPQVSQATPVIAVFSMVLVGLVLLLACTNISNVLLIHAVERGKEIAVRSALGATRARIARLLLTESLLLGVLGGATGVLVAFWVTAVLQSRHSSVDLPIHVDWSPDGHVLLFATAVSLATGIVCGVMPALAASHPNLTLAINQGGRATVRKRLLSSVLVTGQVGVSMLLLVVAGLFVRGAQKAEGVDLGFDRKNLQLLALDLSKDGYDEARGREFIRRLLDEAQSLPGVRSVSVAKYIPFAEQGGESVFRDEQAGRRRVDGVTAFSNTVGLNYFQVMGIPILKGRDFDEHDDETARRVVVINEALASRLWPGQDPTGRFIRLLGDQRLQVIGVVKTGKYAFLTEQPRPYLYLPLRQHYTSPTIFHVRTATDVPQNLVSALRVRIHALDADVLVYGVTTMQEHLQHGYLFSAIVLGGALSGVFGALGLALASVGLYGVVSNTVGQRTHEIGIRAALGATRRSILGLVTRQGMLLVVIGASLGLASGIAAARLLTRVLFSVDPGEPLTFATAVLVLCGVALPACAIPARAALRIDPIVALRHD
jgi:predicted permease